MTPEQKAEEVFEKCYNGHGWFSPGTDDICIYHANEAIAAALAEARRPSPALREFIEAANLLRAISQGEHRDEDDCAGDCIWGQYDRKLAALRKEMGL